MSYEKYYGRIPLPLFVVDLQGSVIYANGEGKKILPEDENKESYRIDQIWMIDHSAHHFMKELNCSSTENPVEIVFTSVLDKEAHLIEISYLEENLMLFVCMKTLTSNHEENMKQELSELHLKHDFLIAENPDGIIFVDPDGRITDINQSLQFMIGYEKCEIIHTYEHNISFQELKRIKYYTNKALRGKAQVYETSITHKNGDLIYIEVKTIPIKIHQSYIGAYNILKDITAYKLAQQEAFKQEELLRSLINSMPEFVVFQNHDGRILEMNQYAKKLFNLEGQEVVGKTFTEIGSTEWDAIPFLKEAFPSELTKHNASNIQFEHQLLHNGEERTFDIVKAAGPLGEGKRGYLISIGRDSTHRKKVEEDLIETKELLESIFSNSADGISVITLNGEVLKTNLAFQRLYGYSEEEMPLNMMEFYPDGNRDEAKSICDTVTSGKEIIGYEDVRKHKDGRLLEVSVTYSPLRDQDGNVLAISAFTRYIGDRKRTEELLIRSEKLSVIGQLAAAVAHEVRNPLTAVKGFIQLYKDKIDGEIHELMLSEMNRTENIISEFLSLAKPQAVTYQQANVTTLICETLSIMDSQARINNVCIKKDLQEALDFVECEVNQIKQVLINLIKNGIESMPGGGELTIQTSQEDETFRIAISDQGVGISEERLKHLGDPFFSNKEAGTGLGLVVCYKIVHEHGGRIEFDSELGVGTTVSVLLPLKPLKVPVTTRDL
ncbi:PAS domain-containing sensor histidine kinase [Bacillus sp. N1-1]|uniref:PAS domain-containing sensor histidine kinase n=1 Tax=Bacillus sp. N1-1 TaxID=2682541 RepID=UPI0013199A7E|nr:PAS domain-containing sensor histidine kinase [Bacillus sp. N1-1]QHA93574.1 PAS domain S-box protein [Bacillus sp. N1-1]